MPNIRTLTRADITAMAHAAAERGEPADTANVFTPGTVSHRAFEVDYFEHFTALSHCACACEV